MAYAPNTQPGSKPFPIPEPAIARHPGVVLAPRELRSWADSLPLGNPPRAAQLMMAQIQLLVRDPEPGPKLPALLEIYEAPARRLLDIVQDRLHGNLDDAVPLDQFEHAMIEVLSEMAYGHLRIANNLMFAGKPPPATLLYRVLDLLDTARNIERLRYGRRAVDNWRLMLEIYLRADDSGVAAETIEQPLRRSGEPATIRGLFFRALIISLCDPHHHRPRDVLAWHAWAGRHTDKMQLGILPQGALSIPLDTSGEMSPLSSARRGKPGQNMRYLATDEFLRALRENDDAPAGLYDALSGLIKGRKAPEQRQSPRQVRNHPFRLLFGLRRVHARLDALTSGMRGDDPDAPPFECTQINQSKSGAAFRLPGSPNPPLAIGEVILAEADNPTPGGAPVGFVGRIQRLISTDDGQIEVGVQKLAGRLMPVTLSGSAAERSRGDTYGLLQQEPDSGRLTLLATRTLYREGDSVTVEAVNARYNLRLRALEGTTGRMAYIDVEPLG